MMDKKKPLLLAVLMTFIVSTAIMAQDVVKIDFTKLNQKIDGFGASSAWHGALTAKEAEVSFGNGEGQLGLSILRLRIDPAGQNRWGEELSNARRAKALGVTVFASPWTPPASMKTNKNVVAGELSPTEYGNYVKFLNSYIDYMAKNNVPLAAISLQNEPNIRVTYESCDWSIAQMLDFCKNYAQDIKAPVIVPEAFNFDQAYSNAILNDSTAASHIAIIGGHLYGTTPKKDANAQAKGKPVWMTEHYIDGDDITTCISMAKEISECMSLNMSAYVWWWLRQPSCNIITTGGSSILKKGYTMAHFSKFIRPGYFRSDVSYNQYMGMNITAYAGEKQVIVIVNRNTKSKTIQFELTGDSLAYYQKYVTSATKNLSKEGTVNVLNHLVSVELEPQSITTFVSTDQACEPTTLIPYLKIDSEELQQTAEARVASSSSIQLAPQPSTGGTWSWSGCGVSGSSSIQTFTPVDSCETVATFTNQCGAKSSLNFNITLIPVGIDKKALSNAVSIYPNPVVDGNFTLNVHVLQEQLPMVLKLFNLEGKVVFEQRIEKNWNEIETGLAPAIYFLNLTGKEFVHDQKLIIK